MKIKKSDEYDDDYDHDVHTCIELYTGTNPDASQLPALPGSNGSEAVFHAQDVGSSPTRIATEISFLVGKICLSYFFFRRLVTNGAKF